MAKFKVFDTKLNRFVKSFHLVYDSEIGKLEVEPHGNDYEGYIAQEGRLEVRPCIGNYDINGNQVYGGDLMCYPGRSDMTMRVEKRGPFWWLIDVESGTPFSNMLEAFREREIVLPDNYNFTEGNKMATKTESIEKKVVPYYHKELEEDIIGHYDGENKIELIPLCTKEYTYFSTTEEDEFLQIKKEDEGYVFDIVDSAFDHIDELGFLFHSDIEEEEEE